MKVLHSDQGLFDGGPSIFLAGPTPRDSNTLSWRLEALRILESLKFDGTVLVPERQNWSSLIDYADQIDWELDSLTKASVIAFWVPRNMANMPALTTNVEFGYWLAKSPERVLYGRPNNATNIRYLDSLYKKECPSGLVYTSLLDLLAKSVDVLSSKLSELQSLKDYPFGEPTAQEISSSELNERIRHLIDTSCDIEVK